MPDDFDQVASPASKNVEIASVWIATKTLLHEKSKTRESTPHVRVPGRQPDPRVARQRNHRRATVLDNALMIFTNVSASGAPAIFMRTFAPNSMDIVAGDNDERSRGISTGSGAIATGTKEANSPGGRAKSDNSRRQRYKTAILKVANFQDSQIAEKMIHGWDEAFAIPSRGFESRLRRLS